MIPSHPTRFAFVFFSFYYILYFTVIDNIVFKRGYFFLIIFVQ